MKDAETPNIPPGNLGHQKPAQIKYLFSTDQLLFLLENYNSLTILFFFFLSETPQLNPMIEPLSWMLGTWLSDPPGDGAFPTMMPFQYLEEVHISHVGQPMLNFS